MLSFGVCCHLRVVELSTECVHNAPLSKNGTLSCCRDGETVVIEELKGRNCGGVKLGPATGGLWKEMNTRNYCGSNVCVFIISKGCVNKKLGPEREHLNATCSICYQYLF